MRGIFWVISAGLTLLFCACTDEVTPPTPAAQVQPVASAPSPTSIPSAPVLDVNGSGMGRVFVTEVATGSQAEITPELDQGGNALVLRGVEGKEVSTAFGVTITRPGGYVVMVKGVWVGPAKPAGNFMRVSVGSWNPPRMDAEQAFEGASVAADGNFNLELPVVVPDVEPAPEIRVSLTSAGEVRIDRLSAIAK